MTPEILTAILSFIGTAVGALGGIIASNKAVDFRLKSLEQKVERHNRIVERTYQLEGKVREIEHEVFRNDK